MSFASPIPQALRLLADPMRWRVLRLLQREPLNVSELTRVLGLAQSGVSRHLRLLKEGALVSEERRGGWSWFAAAEPPSALARLWPSLCVELDDTGDPQGDDARLAEVLREREEQGAPDPRARGAEVEPGRSWAAWSQALTFLLPAQRVLHLGCGSGALTLEAARWALEVVAVESDERLLEAARRRLGARLAVRLLHAQLDQVPCPEATFDVALLGQILHRVERPEAVLAEALRLLRPGATLLVLDLLPHKERWVEQRLGHRRLGLEPETLTAWLVKAGFEAQRVEAAPRRRGNPFVVLLATARRPARPLPTPASPL